MLGVITEDVLAMYSEYLYPNTLIPRHSCVERAHLVASLGAERALKS